MTALPSAPTSSRPDQIRLTGSPLRRGVSALLVATALAASTQFAGAEVAGAHKPSAASTSLAAAVFAQVSPAVIVLTTTLADSDQRASHGSGFVINEHGWAITNFHVIADALFEADRYRLSHRQADGSLQHVRVLAIDVINDLAVVAVAPPGDGPAPTWLPLPLSDNGPTPALGESVFALGNPLDLGLTVTQGTYSGTIAGSFDSRIHLTGALNPGMSGGPAVDAGGRLVGVNVARSLNGELVSFLVPAHLARALVVKAEQHADVGRSELGQSTLRDEIGEQLRARQAQITDLALAENWRREPFGPYEVPVLLGDYADCGSYSNDSPQKPPAARFRSLSCNFKTYAFPQPDNRSATLSYNHVLVTPRTPGELNPFQIAAAATSPFSRNRRGHNTMMARQHCEDRLTYAGADASLPVQVSWCAQAYREFEGVYDIRLSIATQDLDDTVLISRLDLEGFTFESALELTRKYLQQLQRTPNHASPS
ncbi:MAG: S1C family serine protease [Rhodocyclaceae bacterium]